MNTINETTEEDDIYNIMNQMVGFLIFYPENLEMKVDRKGSVITCWMRAHADDAGKIIGQGGKHFKAMQYLLEAMCRKKGFRSLLQPLPSSIVGEKYPNNPHFVDASSPHEEFTELLQELTDYIFESPVKITEFRENNSENVILELTAGNAIDAKLLTALETPLKDLWKAFGHCVGLEIALRVAETA